MIEKYKGYNRRQIFVFALLNLPISILICLPFFLKSSRDLGAPLPTNALMFLSDIVFLNLIPLVAVMLLSLIFRTRAVVMTAAVALATLLHTFLLIDYRIFSFFKFHVNGLIINFLATEGAGDSLSLGKATFLTLGVIIIILLALETAIARRVFMRDAFSGLGRRMVAASAFLLALVVLDKAVYAYADLTNNMKIISNARYYPYYQKVTVKRFASRWFGYKVDRERGIDLSDAGKTLTYPLKPLEFGPNAKRYNILIILVDGFRSDMLAPDVMPNLSRLGKENLHFLNHYSGGNGTRFGIFSLFYGLYGNLWHPFLEARRSPVFMDSLMKLDYQFTINSSTRLTYPEFRKTIFIKTPDAVFDEHPEEVSALDRDRIIVGKFEDFLGRRDEKRPFMGFLFFNSSHQYYQYPREFEKFRPVLEGEVNYVEEFPQDKIEKLKNRYRNSLYYIDSLIDRTVRALLKNDVYKNTIIVVTGDHGEEFMENGHFSHNAAFNDYQIKTALVMRVPGRRPERIRRLTSHLDIVPTIMPLLGCRTPAENYAHGADIFSGKAAGYVFSSDWTRGAIVTEQYRIIMPITAGRGSGLEVRSGKEYALVDDNEVVKRRSGTMLEVAKKLAAFLK